MVDALPTPPQLVLVEAAVSHPPYVMLGFVATGSANDLDCVERLSTGPGVIAGRTKGPKDIPEVMVGFSPGGSRKTQIQVYRDARSGSCPGAKIEVTIMPVEALNKKNPLDSATIEAPSFINEPTP